MLVIYKLPNFRRWIKLLEILNSQNDAVFTLYCHISKVYDVDANMNILRLSNIELFYLSYPAPVDCKNRSGSQFHFRSTHQN